jgi:hypothetical protein
MAAALLTPFSRGRRGSWGAGAQAAALRYPGDELVRQPRWGWTHGIGVEAPAADVWPWVAQIGADRGGFYSYQWLENVIGCQVRNAAEIHPEWAAGEDGELRLHPKALPLRIVSVQPGRAGRLHGASTHPERRPAGGVPAPGRAGPEQGPLDDGELAVPRRAGRPGPVPGHQPLPVRYFR